MFLNYTFSWKTTTCQKSATFCESMIFRINSWILWVMMASTSIMKYKTSCWITLIGDSVVVYEMIQFETRPYLLRSYLWPWTWKNSWNSGFGLEFHIIEFSVQIITVDETVGNKHTIWINVFISIAITCLYKSITLLMNSV